MHEPLITMEQFCGDVSTLFQSHSCFTQYQCKIVVLLLKAHTLNLQDAILLSMLLYSYRIL